MIIIDITNLPISTTTVNCRRNITSNNIALIIINFITCITIVCISSLLHQLLNTIRNSRQPKINNGFCFIIIIIMVTIDIANLPVSTTTSNCRQMAINMISSVIIIITIIITIIIIIIIITIITSIAIKNINTDASSNIININICIICILFWISSVGSSIATIVINSIIFIMNVIISFSISIILVYVCILDHCHGRYYYLYDYSQPARNNNNSIKNNNNNDNSSSNNRVWQPCWQPSNAVRINNNNESYRNNYNNNNNTFISIATKTSQLQPITSDKSQSVSQLQLASDSAALTAHQKVLLLNSNGLHWLLFHAGVMPTIHKISLVGQKLKKIKYSLARVGCRHQSFTISAMCNYRDNSHRMSTTATIPTTPTIPTLTSTLPSSVLLSTTLSAHRSTIGCDDGTCSQWGATGSAARSPTVLPTAVKTRLRYPIPSADAGDPHQPMRSAIIDNNNNNNNNGCLSIVLSCKREHRVEINKTATEYSISKRLWIPKYEDKNK